MNLEPVSKALAEHRSSGGAARDSEQRTLRRMTNGLIAGVVVVLFGMLLVGFLPGRAFKFVGVAAAILGLIAVLVSAMTLRRPTRDVGAVASPDALDDTAPTTGRLLHEQTFEPARTSITDHTTELLNVEVKDRSPQD